MSSCLLCKTAIDPFISFGNMPVANGFLAQEDFASEPFFPLEAGFCERCSMMQLINPVPAERMFHGTYPFFTSSSAAMTAHFHRLAGDIGRGLAHTGDPFVVEIGSNDGTLLQPLAQAGMRHLGVDPSSNVADAARAKGISTLCRFFDAQTAREITQEYGRADAIVACNCFCHIGDLDALAEGIRILLKPSGTLIFEDPYAGDILRLTSYDQIYDEHVWYFSLGAVTRWLARFGLEVIDAKPQDVHGGSMRYTAALHGTRTVDPAVDLILAAEARSGLFRQSAYVDFRHRVESSRSALVQLLSSLKTEGKRVVGYGATSKSTTVLNYCGITPSMVEFISDTTPLKQGKFSPGAHLPVRSHAEFAANYPDYALLFAWNHSAEVLAKEEAFIKSGGRWIGYVPEVGVL